MFSLFFLLLDLFEESMKGKTLLFPFSFLSLLIVSGNSQIHCYGTCDAHDCQLVGSREHRKRQWQIIHLYPYTSVSRPDPPRQSLYVTKDNYRQEPLFQFFVIHLNSVSGNNILTHDVSDAREI